MYKEGDHPGLSRSTPNQQLRPPPEESDLGDISGSIYSQYSELAEGEDNNMAERCQKDADGILFFVSPHFAIQTAMCIQWNIVDWFILCRSCRAACHVRPGPEAESSSQIRILS